MSTSVAELRALLEQRFPESCVAIMPGYGLVTSGIDHLDSLMSGGLRPGTLSLISGGMSSGKTSVALAFAARLSREQGSVAWLHSGALSAPSAAHGGMDLDFLLQVEARSLAQLQRCLDIILRDAAFPLVVVDWSWPLSSNSSWQRLRTLLRGSRSALLVLSPPLPRAASLRFLAAMHLHAVRPWNECSGAGQVEVFLQKSRFGAPGGSVRLAYGNASGPFSLCAELPGLGQEWNTGG